MIVLLIGLIIDIILLVFITAKNRNINLPLRFAAFSVIINLFAYYTANGLSESFGINVLFDIICTVAAKIFILYTFSVFKQNNKTQNPVVYIMAIAVSFCVYNTPLPGIICGIILFAYLFYVEYSNKDETTLEQPKSTDENSLYLRTIAL